MWEVFACFCTYRTKRNTLLFSLHSSGFDLIHAGLTLHVHYRTKSTLSFYYETNNLDAFHPISNIRTVHVQIHLHHFHEKSRLKEKKTYIGIFVKIHRVCMRNRKDYKTVYYYLTLFFTFRFIYKNSPFVDTRKTIIIHTYRIPSILHKPGRMVDIIHVPTYIINQIKKRVVFFFIILFW